MCKAVVWDLMITQRWVIIPFANILMTLVNIYLSPYHEQIVG